MKDFVSVIVPAYNAETTIERCIQSLIHQTYANIEIIVVDDGSTDKTPQILDTIRLRWPVEIIRISNGGVAKARNAGLAAATGDWIAFSDADDYYEPNSFSELVDWAERMKCPIVQGGLNRTGLARHTGTKYVVSSAITQKVLLNYATELGDEFGYFSSHVRSSIHGPCGKIFSRKLIVGKHIKFDENLKLGEDLLFYLQALTNADEVGLLTSDVYNVSSNLDSVTRSYYPDSPNDVIHFYQATKKYLTENNSYDSLKQDFAYQIYAHINVAVAQYFFCKANPKTFVRRFNEWKKFLSALKAGSELQYLKVDKTSLPEKISVFALKRQKSFFYFILKEILAILKR